MDEGFAPHDSVPVLHATANEEQAAVREEILAAIGPLNGWRPWDQVVIGATYLRGGKTPGGIILTDHRGGLAHNDRLTGKAFLLVAHGPDAFPTRLLDFWGGEPPAPGSWFVARPSDGMEISLHFPGASDNNRRKERGWPCRAFLAKDLIAPLPHPGWIV